jgi:hypothetical protein
VFGIAPLIRLGELISPPDSPVRAYGDWKRFVSTNGFFPPDDYRMLIREYGAGTFADWLHLVEPFNPSWSFMEKVQPVCEKLRRSPRASAPSGLDWPIWPESEGLLPWGVTVTGGYVCWRTSGRPDSWTTVVAGDQGWVEYQLGAVGFLVGLAERSLGDPRLDDDGGNPFVDGKERGFAPSTS